MTTIDAKSIRRALRDGAEARSGPAAAALAASADDAGLLDVAYAYAETPLGEAVVAATGHGVVTVSLPNTPHEAALERLAARVSPRILESRPRLDPVLAELDQYFAGRRQSFDVPLDWRLVRSPFCRRVLERTASVPFGRTTTYAQVAAGAGSPRAHRAAGSALGSNPLPIVVPCHRVVRSGGDLGNYGGGPEMKRFLLELEGALPTRLSG